MPPLRDDDTTRALGDLRLALGAHDAGTDARLAAVVDRLRELTATIDSERETHAAEMRDRDIAARETSDALRELTGAIGGLRAAAPARAPRSPAELVPRVLATLGEMPAPALLTVAVVAACALLAAPAVIVAYTEHATLAAALVGG